MPNDKIIAEIKRYSQVLENLQKSIAKQKWYAQGWTAKAYTYPDAKQPRGTGFVLCQSAWANGRIHFECWLGAGSIKKQVIPIVLHVETNEKESGLNKKRILEVLGQRCKAKVNGWAGYKMSATSAGEPIRGKIAFDEGTLGQRLSEEFDRLRGLAPDVNTAIAAARSQ